MPQVVDPKGKHSLLKGKEKEALGCEFREGRDRGEGLPLAPAPAPAPAPGLVLRGYPSESRAKGTNK